MKRTGFRNMDTQENWGKTANMSLIGDYNPTKMGLNEAKALYYHWYPNYSSINVYRPDKFAQAFKVVSMMIEKEYIKGITLKRFIKIVKEVEGNL